MAKVCQFLFLIGVVYASAVGDFFTENPMSITVTLGGDVHFWCKTAEQFGCHNMNWMYTNSKTEGDPFGNIGTCRTPKHWNTAANKRLTQSFDDGRFGLHITNVSYQDSGRYTCWVFRSEGEVVTSEYSGVAFLTVLSPVPTPLCRYIPEVVSVNDDVRLICAVPSDANIEVTKLTWVYDSLSPIRGVQVERGRTYSKVHTLKDSDNYKIFICVAGADLTNGPNCTLSPLQIPTTVDITPVFLDESTYMFVCNADALPPVTNYHWNVQEMDSFSKEWRDLLLDNSQIQNEGTTLVINAGRDFGQIGRRLSIECTVSNSIGLTKTSAPVRLLHCSRGAIVTELTRCEDLPETTTTTVTTAEPTGFEGKGGPQGTVDDLGVYVWIIVAAVILLVVVAIVCCICLVRYRRLSKKSSTNGGLGVAYSTNAGSVDLRSQTGTSESNALMMDAEAVLATSNTTLHQLHTRPENTAGNESPRIVAVATSHGLHGGETYASIDDSHQTQRANQELRHSAEDLNWGSHKSIPNDYDAIGPHILQQSVITDGTSRRNSSGVDLSDSTYASVDSDLQSKEEVRLPPELSTRTYESVDLNISQVHASVRDSSSLKKVCVVSPTCHLNDGGDNQVVYAMPDKQRKLKMGNGDKPMRRPVEEPPAPPGAVYAKPDKKQKKSVQKYGKKSTSNDCTSKPSVKSSPQNVPEGLYAMPDKSQNRSTTSSVNSQDAKDDASDLKSAIPGSELPSNIHNLALSRSNSIKTPKKPHRTASSKVAGSRILRDSLRRQNDSDGGKSQPLSRSSSTEMDNLEASTPSSVPAELNNVSDTVLSIPIYAMPDKGSK